MLGFILSRVKRTRLIRTFGRTFSVITNQDKVTNFSYKFPTTISNLTLERGLARSGSSLRNFGTICKYVYGISTLLSNIFAVCFEKLLVNYDSFEKEISMRNIPSLSIKWIPSFKISSGSVNWIIFIRKTVFCPVFLNKCSIDNFVCAI